MRNIVIIEDNQDLTHALTFSIESTGKYKILKSYTSGEEAVKDIGNNLPDFVIMDIELEGKMNGVTCTSLLKKKYPQLEILMLTVFDDSEQVFDALRSGACGYMTKNTSFSDIINALDEASAGGAPMSFKIARMVLNSFKTKNDSPLTVQENKILNLLAKGASYKTAAIQLNISTETVKFHIKNLYIKLQVNNKEDAIVLARKNKWV
ncbi:response regulator [Flavobacterium pectinovorum]|uniref:response regulator n=1 Tax=Flavobacterium pectinovorum TaxID=29533 RepID=UPI001FAE38B1|nr:response regulator transcription factor [Flavobacterium pectinovorum]MCI9843932.1 response regulator transcription factor [Flavobacterium pectinovorum]